MHSLRLQDGGMTQSQAPVESWAIRSYGKLPLVYKDS